MQLKLEELPYQQDAIQSVVDIFDGTARNTFDNATDNGIRSNRLIISPEEIGENIKKIYAANGILDDAAKFECPTAKEVKFGEETVSVRLPFDVCVEMETGTGKTLVYLKTLYSLYKEYGFTKFIILVPSIAIRQGVLQTLRDFEKQLNDIYDFTPNYFEYDSKRIHEVGKFVEEQYPQIMVATTGSIVGDTRILNREQREDLFDNLPFVDLLARTRPVIVMDEPQVGMDAEATSAAINRLDPLVRIRFSATHRKAFTTNLIYRLTPYESYAEGLVKKIDVLTVVEKNDEASLKMELHEVQNVAGNIKAKLKAWKKSVDGEQKYVPTQWLKVGDSLAEKTKNSIYAEYEIENIRKDINDDLWRVTFVNQDFELAEKQGAGNIEAVWAMQIEFLIKEHFKKAVKLRPKGIKVLSLVFINLVANYVGDNPIIKRLFVDKYREIYPTFHDGNVPTDEEIRQVQGYYFAHKSSGEPSDTEGGQSEQRRIYDLILKDKKTLLALDNPVQFIFSHSALGVGWDNPNVFNIATLSTTYSEIKKRQEIGRGLRICVDQDGERKYDKAEATDGERINKLTVIPNETYETFARQYQEEIEEVYGTSTAGAGMTHSKKGVSQNTVKFNRSAKQTVNNALRAFWDALAKETTYTVAFDDEKIIEEAVRQIEKIRIPHTIIEAVLQTVDAMTEEGFKDTYKGDSSKKIAARFSSLDLIEELSEETHLSYASILRIVGRLSKNDDILKHWIKNPPMFVQKAAAIIKDIELRSMIRGLEYHVTGEKFEFKFDDYEDTVSDQEKGLANTPNYGVYNVQKVDSAIEKRFAERADSDNQIVCILKLPKHYRVPTPIGWYEPDFGIVLKRADISTGHEDQYHFVVETKGSAKLGDMKALRESENFKMNCALKHFKALGVDLDITAEDIYKAPIKEYNAFKDEITAQFN
ncbi:MAG: DEAD/DEAH box helicase family protein [Pyrinomonadaceae bacterium]